MKYVNLLQRKIHKICSIYENKLTHYMLFSIVGITERIRIHSYKQNNLTFLWTGACAGPIFMQTEQPVMDCSAFFVYLAPRPWGGDSIP